MGHYRIPIKLCILFQIEAGACAVPTADTVATSEVNYYCIVPLSTLPRFAETISQEYCCAVLAGMRGWCHGLENPARSDINFVPLSLVLRA